MNTAKILILSAFSFLISFFITPWARKLSMRIGMVDEPNFRKIHNQAVPYGGGIAIFLGFLAAFIFLNKITPENFGFLIGSFVIIILGILDDKIGLSAAPKFFFQSVAALIVIYFGIRIDMSLLLQGRVDQFSFLALPLTFLWIVGITNAINIIDGLDGLAAGVATISAFTIAAVGFINGFTSVAVMALIVGFASLGFLPHNMNKDSRVFMGDAGSMFLGFALATLSIMGSVKLAAAFSLFVPMMILAIPIFDTLFAISRRIITKQPIYEGDKKHLHHRLLEMGFSPLQTVLLIYFFSLIFGAMAVFSAFVRPRIGYLVFLASLLIVLLIGWLVVYFHQKKNGKEKS